MNNMEKEIDNSKLAVATDSSKLFGWAKKWADSNFLWSFPVGTSCCNMEYPLAFGYSRKNYTDPFPSNEDAAGCDLLIVSGSIAHKFVPYLKELYAQLEGPRWVMAVGACAISGGPYNSYATIGGLSQLFPVDIYVPGCPPSPASIYQGIELLKIRVHRKLYQGSNLTESVN